MVETDRPMAEVEQVIAQIFDAIEEATLWLDNDYSLGGRFAEEKWRTMAMDHFRCIQPTLSITNEFIQDFQRLVGGICMSLVDSIRTSSLHFRMMTSGNPIR